MLRTHWGNRAVSVVGNKVVRTGGNAEHAADTIENTNDELGNSGGSPA